MKKVCLPLLCLCFFLASCGGSADSSSSSKNASSTVLSMVSAAVSGDTVSDLQSSLKSKENYPVFQKYVREYAICLYRRVYYFENADTIGPDDLFGMFMFFIRNDGIDAEQWFAPNEKDTQGNQSCYVIPADTVLKTLNSRLKLTDAENVKKSKYCDPKTGTFRIAAFAAWSEGLGFEGDIPRIEQLDKDTIRFRVEVYCEDLKVYQDEFTIEQYTGGYRYLSVRRVETYEEGYDLSRDVYK